jgi:hypothetical protein
MRNHKPTPKPGTDHISYATDTPSVAARCDTCGSVIYVAGRGAYWRHKARHSWATSRGALALQAVAAGKAPIVAVEAPE